MAYKGLKYMSKNEQDTPNLNIIPGHKWTDHCNAPWYNKDAETDYSSIRTVTTYEVNKIHIQLIRTVGPGTLSLVNTSL